MFSPEGIVYLLVLLQLIVISVTSSYRWTKNQLNIFNKYGPAEYPQFYVFTLNTELINIGVRTILDITAIVLVCYVIHFDLVGSFGIYIGWALCTGFQLLPSFYSLATLQLANRLRQKTIKQKIKNISIVYRSIFDYISISYLVLLFVAILLTLNILVSNEQFVMSKKLGLITVFIVTVFLLVRQIYNSIYGSSGDKLISDDDKTEKRKQDVQRCLIGIAASVVIFSLLGLNSANHIEKGVWLIVPLSLFVQLSVFHRSKRWHAENMGVYREGEKT